MRKLFNWLFNRIAGADYQALIGFYQNFYWGNNLPTSQAQKQAEHGVIELIDIYGRHLANGCLITGNGYFVSADHCLIKDEKTLVRTTTGEQSSVSRICKRNSDLDIVLAKARLSAKVFPQLYKFFPANKFSSYRKIPVVALIRRNGKIERKGGFTNGQFVHTAEHWDGTASLLQAICDMETIPGDSGGLVVTNDGMLIGLVSGGDNANITTIVSWYEILKLITQYCSRR